MLNLKRTDFVVMIINKMSIIQSCFYIILSSVRLLKCTPVDRIKAIFTIPCATWSLLNFYLSFDYISLTILPPRLH